MRANRPATEAKPISVQNRSLKFLLTRTSIPRVGALRVVADPFVAAALAAAVPLWWRPRRHDLSQSPSPQSRPSAERRRSPQPTPINSCVSTAVAGDRPLCLVQLRLLPGEDFVDPIAAADPVAPAADRVVPEPARDAATEVARVKQLAALRIAGPIRFEQFEPQ